MITEKILEILQSRAENTVDLIDMFTSGYSASYKKARRSMLYGAPAFKTDWADWYRRRQIFHSLLNKLKREEFIIQKEKRRNSPWSITPSGMRWLIQMKKKSREWSALPRSKYQNIRRGQLVIIAFDVPERERRKRTWLRIALISLGFTKLQQSVWAGNVKLPQKFIDDMKQVAVLPYVHIFSVVRGGTLQKIS